MMLTMAALLVVFRIWATVLDFWSMAKSKRSLHCTHPYPVLLALAVSYAHNTEHIADMEIKVIK